MSGDVNSTNCEHIASVCIREQLSIMHNDADLHRLAEHSQLTVHRY
jgi:hypothetical protein